MGYILAVDQGTTSTRTIIFGADGAPLSVAQEEFRQIYPHPGWIEHDPNDIWQTTLTTMRSAAVSLARRPDHVPTLVIAGRAALAGDDVAGAAVFFRRAAALAPERADAAFLTCVTLLELGDPEASAETIRPRPDPALTSLGKLR